MTKPDIAIGIDVGTTGVKSIAIDGSWRVVAESTREHDVVCKHPGWAEEDTADWWTGAVTTLKDLWAQGVDPRRVASVGVSGMVPAIVMLDEGDQPVRLAIQQNDGRAVAELQQLKGHLQGVYQRTGSHLNQQHVLPRLLWVKRHEPGPYARIRTVMGSYDYVTFRLTGVRSIEVNWAVESGLYDIHRAGWVREYVDLLELPAGALPPIKQPADVVGVLSAEAAAETGLAPGTPVIAGSADHVASAVAAGVRRPGDLLIKFGGAGDILFCTDRLVTHEQLYIDQHDLPGLYLLNGCMAASGSLVKWFVQEFVRETASPSGSIYSTLDDEAEGVPPGSEGLVVLPYFLGEKTPLFDPMARGVFFGMTLHHRRGHLFRAMLEAVIYGFRHHLDVIREAGQEPVRVLATNGGVKSRLWRQIAADALGMAVTSFRNHPGSVLGVAFVAGKAAGLFTDWAEIDRFLTDPYLTTPDPQRRAAYDLGYRLYRQIYEHLKPDFRLLYEGQVQKGAEADRP